MGEQLPIIPGQVATNASPMLKTLLDSIPTGIEILSPVQKNGAPLTFYTYTQMMLQGKTQAGHRNWAKISS